jgi:steroid 5-alpha reductase family enzyme
MIEGNMDFFSIYLMLGLVILVAMILLWLLSLMLRDSSIVDILWGTTFVIATWVAYLLTPEGFALRKLLLNVLVTIWGLRLSLHILRRNWGKPEDFRYQVWRKEAGATWWWRSLFKVFSLQGFSFGSSQPPYWPHKSAPSRIISRGSISWRCPSG